MKQEFIAFTAHLQTVVTSVSDRQKVATAAIALATSRAVSLPSTAVQNSAEYFELQVADGVKTILSSLNEKLIFNVREALDRTRQLWNLRYVSAHPDTCKVADLGNYGFFDTIMGVGMHVDPEFHAFVNQYKKEILCLTGLISQAVELAGSSNQDLADTAA